MVVSSQTNTRLSRRWILASLLFGVILVGPTKSKAQDLDVDDGVSKAIPFCGSDDSVDVTKRLLYVTTLDGKLSALDVTNKGEVRWTIDTGEPLLSSSIHKLDLSNNGKWVRMIPSLSGGLYKFDGDSIEAIPIRAEDLLKSSFKFSDDIVISGGMETNSYGISTKTGQILYECTLRGCQNYTHSTEPINSREPHNPLSDDVLILKRETQTVRAIEPREGVERWNFSIGMHHLDLMESKDCHSKSTSEELKDLLANLEFKAVIPQGMICAYSKNDPSRPLWTYQFDHPIVSAWRSGESGNVKAIDFFAGADWLWNGHLGVYASDDEEGQISPSLYLGMYEKQPYIQESTTLMQITHHRHHTGNIITDSTDFPKIPFKPYPAAPSALQLIEDHSNETDEEQSGFESNGGGGQGEYSTALSVLGNSVLYASEYVNGNGFYFYTSSDLNKTQKAICDSEAQELTMEDYDTDGALPLIVRAQSLMYWWKEIVIIVTTTVVLVHLFLSNRPNEKEYIVVERPVPVKFAREAVEGVDYSKSLSSQRSSSESNTSDQLTYQSRFATDFDVVQILGKGGFGVVFAVKNKIDDCHYAIKRIVLPAKQESRDRVMREVKTLANCEHQNIVRYFHAWIETPPPGWQEEQDRLIRDRELFSTSIDIGESPSLVSSPALPEFSKVSIPSPSADNGIINRTKEWLNLRKDHFDLSQLKSIGRRRNGSSTRKSGGELDEADEDTSGIQFDSNLSDNVFNGENDVDDSHIVFKDSTNGKPEIQIITPTSKDVVVPINVTSNGTEEEEVSCSSESNNNKALALYRKTSKRPKSLDLTNRTSDLLREIPKVQSKMYLYIQMQLCQKQSLKDWLSQHSYEERKAQVVNIFEQIIGAVEYVHLKGLIHRDLKPSNIFFALDGQIKIGDFGLVTDNAAESPQFELNRSVSASDGSKSNSSHHRHTQQVGTHLYMSPEQVSGLPYNYKVDIYSLGLILFELFVTFSTEMERINTLKSVRNNKIPDEFQQKFQNEFQLLQIMLSPNPGDRPTTFGIRARPPLSHSVANVEWHFELPPRQRRESSRTSGSGDWKGLVLK